MLSKVFGHISKVSEADCWLVSQFDAVTKADCWLVSQFDAMTKAGCWLVSGFDAMTKADCWLVSWFDAVTKADRWLACQFISHNRVIGHCLLWWISTCGQWKKKLPPSDHRYKKGNKRGDVLHGKLPSKDLGAGRLLFSYQELKTSITN